MKIKEEKRDLFSVDYNYYLAHCISDDFALGAGIAVEFNKRFDMRRKLKEKYPTGYGGAGCILIDRVFNLITKEKCYHKPTYQRLQRAIESMCDICNDLDINYIAMPRIGCGLDRLDWDNVKNIIEEVFQETEVKVLVCSL